MPFRERERGEAAGPDAQRSQAEAARRAKGKIRRYCAANRLNRLGTLTYAGEGCHDPIALRGHLAAFFKQLRGRLGGSRIPYLWVPEWHPGGHGLHAHFVVGRFIKRTLIEQSWGRGHVHIKLLGDLSVGSGTLEEARAASFYLAKYTTKGLDGERSPGLHRYEVAQRFQPQSIECYGRTADDAIASASEYMGRAPAIVWRSSPRDGWNAPPSCWVAWDD